MKPKILVALLTLAAAPVANAQPFELCGAGKRVTCVVDGDTFWLDGTKIRIAGIDAPERSKPQCETERALAEKATTRLQYLLSAGTITLETASQDEDVYGRKLRFVRAESRSVGDALVKEGLARKWDGARHSWCE